MANHFFKDKILRKRYSSCTVQKKRPGYWTLYVILGLVFGITGMLGNLQSASAFSFVLDTSSLSGTEARLEFSLFDGDLLENNTATISGLTTNGTLHGTDCTVSCTGGPPYLLSDTGGLGLFLQDLTLGTSVFFDLSFTTNVVGVDPDLLILNLLDPSTNFTLVDTDLDALAAPVPYQDALFVIDLSNEHILTPTSTDPMIGVNTTVPEPSSIVLMALGVLMLYFIGRIRSHHPSVISTR